ATTTSRTRARMAGRYHRDRALAITAILLQAAARRARTPASALSRRWRMETQAEEESRAVGFVCDRQGPALARRERCLKLAGIPFGTESERRPSGTYYKLYVRGRDAVAAHLALQMGGCSRSSRLHQSQAGVGRSLRDIAMTVWEELLLL